MISVSGVYQIAIAMIFHFLDLLTGFIGALRLGELKSSKMRDGLFKKVGFIFCYTLAMLIDTYGSELGLNISVKILPIVIIYTVTTEIVSILENINKINPDLLPENLTKMFHVKQNGGE